jgi:hypothetical protein
VEGPDESDGADDVEYSVSPWFDASGDQIQLEHDDFVPLTADHLEIKNDEHAESIATRLLARPRISEYLCELCEDEDEDEDVFDWTVAALVDGELRVSIRQKPRGATKPKAAPPPPPPPRQPKQVVEETHWIEFQIVRDDGKPAPNVDYEIKTSTGEVLKGTTDKRGLVSFEGIKAGTWEFSLPGHDDAEWKQG